MNKKILIFGAGSIGNHMAFASLKLKNKVFITDIDTKSLKRMKSQVFPNRDGKWNNKIKQIRYGIVFKKDIYDLIIIGTPPKTHLPLLKKIRKSNIIYKKILIEKPLSSYLENFKELKKFNKNNIFIGYNHSVSESFDYFTNLLKKQKKNIDNILINWKEGFKGILGAHSWLKDEFDSYLGYSKLGGGAIQEHSHAVHLAHIIQKELKINFINKAYNKFFYKNNKNLYDNFAQICFKSKKINLNLEIDLITFPPQKKIEAILNGRKISWIHNYDKGVDAVISEINSGKNKIKLFKKTRSTEFENEIKHIFSVKNQMDYKKSRLNILYGIVVMDTIKGFFNEKK